MLSLVMAGVCQTVVTIAMVLWFVPIARWRRAVLAAVRALTLTLGDSYVLLEQDIQRAALVSRVRNSLAWLLKRCKKVAVIAHSQGCAIAYEALRGAATDQIKLFATLGSGLEKLHFLQDVRFRRRLTVSSAIVSPMAAIAAGCLLDGILSSEKTVLIAGISLAIVALITYISVFMGLEQYQKELTASIERPADLPPGGWLDLYATHDTVPAGSNSILEGGVADRIDVFNERSYFTDHTTYFRNRIEVLTALWFALSHMSALPLFNSKDLVVLYRQRAAHRRLTRVLSFLRPLYLIAFIVLIAFRHDEIVSLGASVRNATAATPIADLLAPMGWLGRAVARWSAALLPSSQAALSTRDVSDMLVGSLTFGVSLILWWMVIKLLWNGFCVSQWRAACRRTVQPDTIRRVSEIFKLVTFAFLGSLPCFWVLAAASRREAFTLEVLGETLLFVVAWIVLFFGLSMAAACPWVIGWEIEEATRKGTPLSRSQRQMTATLFIVVQFLSPQIALAAAHWIYAPVVRPWVAASAVIVPVGSWVVFAGLALFARLRRVTPRQP
jgi:hypothetical protein